jgi:hypothetical protein
MTILMVHDEHSPMPGTRIDRADHFLSELKSLESRRARSTTNPSGDPGPSRDAIEMTTKIQCAAEPLGITIHDYLVIGRKAHASFRS